MSLMTALRERYRIRVEPLRSQRRLELMVLGLLVLLLLQLLFTGFRLKLAPSPVPVMPASESLRLSALAAGAGVSDDDSAELRERPLFFEGRRPALVDESEVKAPEKAGKSTTRKPALKLVGVFGADGRQGIIALQSGKQMRLYVGEEVDGWALQAVGGNTATLSNGKDEWSLKLERSAEGISEQVAAQPAAAAPEPEPVDAGGSEPKAGEGNKKPPADNNKEQSRGLVLGWL